MTSLVEIKNNFKNFSLDTYDNLVNIKNINSFLIEYDKIQKQDFIKPIFTLTKKYSNYSNKKVILNGKNIRHIQIMKS